MLEIIALFIVPVYVIYKFPYCYKNRQWIFLPTLLAITYLIFSERYTFYKLGFRFDNLSYSLFPYLIFSLIGLIASVLVAKYLNKKPVKMWWKISHFRTGFITLSFLQELVYRGYLIPKLETIFSSVVTIVLVNSLIFAFIHIIYPNNIRNLVLTFVCGLFFASLYYYYPNLYLITVSHSVLNFVAIYYGIIGPDDFKNKQIIG